MGIHKYKEFSPKFDKSNFIAPGAFVIGRVNLKENASIWFNSVVRADVNSITIGKGVNIQDLSMLHVTEENALSIADFVSVGHSVILHGCTIEEGCLIGMGAKILDGAIIGKHSLVAAGSVVPPNKQYPPGVMIMGAPAKVVRKLSPEEISSISQHYKSYESYAKDYLKDPLFK